MIGRKEEIETLREAAAADRSRHRMQTPEAYTSKLW